MINNMKNQDGIAIVSVIAVIIVLLILVGIGISQLGSKDGILAQSQKSISAYAEKSTREKLETKLLDLNIEKLGNATLEDVLNLKESDSDIKQAYMSGDKAVIIIDEYKCQINKNLEVESVEEYEENTNKVESVKQIRKVKRRITVDKADMFER